MNINILLLIFSFYVTAICIFDFTVVYRVLLVMMLSIVILSGLLARKFILSLYAINYLIIFLYFLIQYAIGYSVSRLDSFDHLVLLAINMASIFSAIHIVSSKKSIESILKIIIYSSFVLCLYFWIVDWKSVSKFHLGYDVIVPFTNFKYSHNAAPMLWAFSFLFISYFKKSNNPIVFSNIYSAVFAISVAFSGARTSLLLIFISLILYPLFLSFNRKFSKINILKYILIVFIAASFYYILIEVNFFYKIIGYRIEAVVDGLSSGEFDESSASSRFIMLKTGWRMMLDKPFVGYGLNTFRTFYGSFGTWSHNSFVELSISGGLFIAVIFYLFHFYAIFFIIKNKLFNPLGSMFLCSLIFLFIQSMLAVSYTTRIIVIILTLVDIYIKDYRQALSNKTNSSSFGVDFMCKTLKSTPNTRGVPVN